MSICHRRYFMGLRSIAYSLLLILTISTFVSSAAHADDSKEQVRQSVKALVNVPAYRMAAVFTDLHTKKHATVTLECVRPDAASVRYEQDGHITKEIIAIGKKVYIRQGVDGGFKAYSGDVATLFPRMQSESLQTFNDFSSAAIVGHQSANGERTTIYKLFSAVDGARSSTQLWISDKSHLPLKADAVASVPDKNQHNRIVEQHVVTTFTYDSSLKLTPPKM